MQRRLIVPRKDYQKLIEDKGFYFHENYWLEDAYYHFSAQEIKDLETATNECYQMYCEAVEACLKDENKLDKMLIPRELRPQIRQSWEDDDLSLYGRFDFAFISGVPKLLEFNGDTPTSLVEASLVQWDWKEDKFPEADQFNSIHENLVQSWKDIHDKYNCFKYYFSSISDNLEDNSTLAYIIETAMEAGLITSELDIRDINFSEGSLYTPDEEPINCMFKLYPWEFMFNDNAEQKNEACLTDMCWIEPLWKCLMSNKAMLPFLYEMFPNSPYILPAYFEPGKMKSYCKKPIFSREGANVELIRNGRLLEKSEGEYGKEGYIYQELVDLPSYHGQYPILGSWIIGGVSAGMGIRETSSRITDNMSHFVPHIFDRDGSLW